MIMDPESYNVLAWAARRVRSLRYGVGLLALMLIFGAISRVTPMSAPAIVALLGSILLLIMLFNIVDRASEATGQYPVHITVLAWGLVMTVLAFLGLTVSAVATGWPERLAVTLGLPEVAAREDQKASRDATDGASGNAALPDDGKPNARSSPAGGSLKVQETHTEASTASSTHESRTASRPDVYYYAKGKDGSVVAAALEKQGLKVNMVVAQLTGAELQTNAIACSPDVPIETLRRVFHAFREAGLPLQFINQFANPAKKNRIEILTYAPYDETGRQIMPGNTPLSDMQLYGLRSCPVELMNP